jgi:hypothetical protein
MRYNGGTAHSCSSIADLVLKNIQRLKAKLALNRWIFGTRASYTPAHYIPVRRGARARMALQL